MLDFGLAKLSSRPAIEDDEQTPPSGHNGRATRLDDSREFQPTVTIPGGEHGTLAYMSPEQVRGQELDARTDLFSFGAVLHEMCTGQLPFPGDTKDAMFDSTLNLAAVPPTRINPNTPPRLEAIIRKALEKDREVRYQSASELRADLRLLKQELEPARLVSQPSVAVPPPVQRSGRPSTMLLFGSALGIVLLVMGWLWMRSVLVVAPAVVTERQLTHNPNDNRVMGNEISPDGKKLAYADVKGLHLSATDTGEIENITLPAELRSRIWGVSWFPDGHRLLLNVKDPKDGFVLWVASTKGDRGRKLRTNVRHAVVSPEGSLIAFTSPEGREIWIMGADGDSPRKIFATDGQPFAALAWSPTGQRIAFIKPKSLGSALGTGSGGSIETVDLEGRDPSFVVAPPTLNATDSVATTLLWLQDRRLIYTVRERFGNDVANLWAIKTDLHNGNPIGAPSKITAWHGVSPSFVGVSRDGRKLTVSKIRRQNDVFVGELKDSGTRLKLPARLTASDSDDLPDAWTHDSKSVLLESNRTGTFQIFKQDLGEDSSTRLVPAPEDQSDSAISPNGDWILYWARTESANAFPISARLMRVPISGGRPQQILETSIDARPSFNCPSRPNTFCVFSRLERGELVFYALDPGKGLGMEVGKSRGPANLTAISPDGTRLAMAKGDRFRQEISILDLRTRAESQIGKPDGWSVSSLAWAADSNSLFLTAGSGSYRIVQLGLNGSMHVLLDRGTNDWLGSAAPSPDGRYLAFGQQIFQAAIWLLEGF